MQTEKTKKIGFIGLGHMGNPMVKNLLQNHYNVTVFDIDQTAQALAISLGAQPTKTPAEMAKNGNFSKTRGT